MSPSSTTTSPVAASSATGRFCKIANRYWSDAIGRDPSRASFGSSKEARFEKGQSREDAPVRERSKKKIQEELEIYFPDKAQSAIEVNQAAHLLKRTLVQLEEIRTGEDRTEDIEKIDAYLFSTFHPQKFDGKDGLSVVMETNFEETCILLGQHVRGDVKRFTVREFHNALKVVRKQLKKTVR